MSTATVQVLERPPVKRHLVHWGPAIVVFVPFVEAPLGTRAAAYDCVSSGWKRSVTGGRPFVNASIIA